MLPHTTRTTMYTVHTLRKHNAQRLLLQISFINDKKLSCHREVARCSMSFATAELLELITTVYGVVIVVPAATTTVTRSSAVNDVGRSLHSRTCFGGMIRKQDKARY